MGYLRGLVQHGPLKNVVKSHDNVVKKSSRLDDRKSSRLEGCTSGPSFSAANQGEIRVRFLVTECTILTSAGQVFHFISPRP